MGDQRAIPAELEGLDEDIAREFMQELPEDTGEPDAVTKPDESAEPEETEEEEISPHDEQQSFEEEDEEDEKKVPYAALKEERGKRKAAQASLSALEQRLNEIQAQLSQPKSQPEAEEGEQKTYYDYVYDAAEESFTAQFKREPDEFNKRDMAILSAITKSIDDTWRTRYQDQQRYVEFKKEVMSKPTFAEVQEHIDKQLQEMSYSKATPIITAYQKAERGDATANEIQLLTDFWKSAEADFFGQKQTAKKPDRPSSEKVVERIKKAEALPRSSQIASSPDTAKRYTEAELERLIQETPWDQIPADVKKQMLGG